MGLGCAADLLFADPRRGHPVAAFGSFATRLERACYADSRGRGVLHAAVATGGVVALAAGVDRTVRGRPVASALFTAAAVWAALGGTSLADEGEAMADLLESDDLAGARKRLSHLCARDASDLDAGELARASVESLAENLSDAVIAPLFWAGIAGAPGVLGYRAANTPDAMVGYRSARYRNFGWASARLDDLVNLAPARLSVGLIALAAVGRGGTGGGSGGAARQAWTTGLGEGAHHPSPNAGYPEAAMAGALGVRLGGGRNNYHGQVEQRPALGADGREVDAADLRDAVTMVRRTTVLAMAATLIVRLTGVAVGLWRGRHRRGDLAGS